MISPNRDGAYSIDARSLLYTLSPTLAGSRTCLAQLMSQLRTQPRPDLQPTIGPLHFPTWFRISAFPCLRSKTGSAVCTCNGGTGRGTCTIAQIERSCQDKEIILSKANMPLDVDEDCQLRRTDAPVQVLVPPLKPRVE